MIRLFLNNREVELNESVSFAINKQFEDITSPADIKNDWSKTVQIPFTQSNHRLFGDLFNIDRLIVEGDDKLMGIYFDPYKKVDFRLQWGDAIIMQGYAKNIDVSKESDGRGHYNITLNGELGRVFQEMKKITFDTTTEEQQYLIDGSKYLEEIISKELLYKLWTSEASQTDLTLYDKTSSNYKVENIFGFAPNNSFNEDFDYQTFQIDVSKSGKFSSVLDKKASSILGEENTYVNLVGIDADTVIGNGLLPRDIGEYRSYLQLPYIFLNKLFQIFINKSKEITGYDFELDPVWFNNSNPYWTRLVYMLKQLNTKKSETKENIYDMRLFSQTINQWSSSIQPTTKLVFDLKPNENFSNETVPVVDWTVDPPVFVIDNKILSAQNNYFGMTLQAEAVYSGGNRVNTKLSPENGLEIEVTFIYNNGNRESGKVLYIDEETTVEVEETDYIAIYKVGNGDTSGAYYTKWDLEIPIIYALYENGGADTAKIEVSAKWLNNQQCFSNTSYGKIANNSNLNVKWLVYENLQHSYATFNLNHLWDNEYNLFNEILNYCKMYRLGIFCDDINKIIKITPLSKYFSKYTISDWTNKLDLTKEYQIQPITFENKYLLFNYESDKTRLNEIYLTNTGLNYGEYRLTTSYEFNNEDKKLFNKIKNSIICSDTVNSWGNLYDHTQIVYVIPKEIYVHNRDKDGKNIDMFGSYWFYNGLFEFDTSSNLEPVVVSDDSSLQLGTQKFFYGQWINTKKVDTYPQLGLKSDNNNLCIFNTPKESYVYDLDYYNNTNGIYNNFWKNYLNERYNKQNKIVTCYLRLTPYDIANFEYNNFIKIDNQLYMINKIYDYQLNENVSTKVDLITIQDINGYTKATTFNIFELYNSNGQKWDYYRDAITLTEVGMTETIYVSSSEPVSWYDDSGELQSMYIYYNNDERNMTNGSGTIPAGDKVPVTFKMDALNDEFGDVIFKVGDKEIKVSVALIVDESFTIYDTDKTLWSSTDKVDLQNTTQTSKTIYITSNVDVQWSATDSTLQDIYINGIAGSGRISAGTLVPVTISYDFSQSEMLEMPITSSIQFYTSEQTSIVNVRVIVEEIFKIYRWDGEVWDEDYDYVNLSLAQQKTQVLYLDANAEVEWSDVNNTLQGLGINVGGDREDWGEYVWSGSGTIPAPSNYKPIYFAIDESLVQGRNEGQIEFYNGRHSWFVDVVLFN